MAEPSAHEPSRSGPGRRDVLLVGVALLLLFTIGLVTDAYDRLEPAIRGSTYGDEAFAVAILLLGGATFLAVREARAARKLAVLRTEAAARATAVEERYRSLVERLPIVAYAWDSSFPAGTAPADYISPQIESLFGVTAESWLQDPGSWEARVHPDDVAAVLAAWSDATADGSPFAAEYRIRDAAGSWRWVRDEANPVGPGVSRAPVYLGAIADITERREAEERFRTLVEQLPAIVFSEDPHTGRLTYVSPQIEAIYGFTAEEWMADPDLWRRRLHPDDHDWVVADEAADTGDEWSIDYRSIARDGETIWVHNEARLLRDADGEPTAWQGVVYDITKRKRAEERLRDAEERFRTLVEQLPVAVYTDAVDEHSTALYISPRYEALTGYSPEQRLREPDLWVRMLHPDDRDRVLAASNETNASGDPFDVEYRIVAADGRTVWLHDHAVLVRDGEGNERWHGVLQDVTERHAAADAIARRDAILEATGFAAERFLRVGSWRADLEEVLHRLAAAGGATRCAVFHNRPLASAQSESEFGVSLVASWPPADPSDDPDHVGDGAGWEASGFGRWAEELGAGRTVHGAVEDFPAQERAELTGRPVPIRSLVAIPIFVEDEWWGYISFDHADNDRRWLEADVEALSLIARTIGAAIERERSTERFEEAQARYRTLIEQIPAVTYIEDSETGREVYSSPQTEQLLGYGQQDWGTREDWIAALHPEDRDRVLEEDDRADSIERPFHAEYRLRTASGDYVWVRDHAAPIPDPSGDPRYWQGVRFDISAEKRAEEQLREAEERYRTLIESIPAVTYIDTLEEPWSTVYVSPQVSEMFGYSPAEWVAPGLWMERVHPDDRRPARDAVTEHAGLGVPFFLEYRMRHKDGRWLWVRDQAFIVRDDDGRPLFSQGVMYDISSEKHAEEQLREAEERYRAIVEHVPAAIYLDQPDGEMRTVYVSPQVREITGVSPDEWLDKPSVWLDIMHPEDRPEVERSYLAAVQAGDSWQGEYRVRTPDGRTVWIHDETTFLHGSDGERVFLQGVLFDVTERKLAEQALRESEQREREAAAHLRDLDDMKNTFLAAVSHELRSPLTSILGLALTLERAPDIQGSERDDLLTRLSANARKLDRLLKDLLDIDRLNRGIVEPQYRVTDVAALARRTVEHLDATGDRTIVVHTDPVVIPVDAPKIERIVENLVMNAVRHTDPDRTIWLTVRPHAGGAEISVEDDGAGVPEEIRTEIFEPFRQGPATSSHTPGTGIGLSLVARFAALHGGRAWVGERHGGGAAFHVEIPGRSPAEGLGEEEEEPRTGTDS